MTTEQLKKANEINFCIEEYEKYLTRAEWMINSNVAERESYLKFIGQDDVKVPITLFKIIGTLIVSEYNNKITELRKELEAI